MGYNRLWLRETEYLEGLVPSTVDADSDLMFNALRSHTCDQ